MRLIRWIRCKLDIGHRLVERWCDEKDAGMTKNVACSVWGCRINAAGQIQYFECLDCGTKPAPFEVVARRFTVVEE